MTEQFYLTHKLDSIRFYQSRNEGALPIPQISKTSEKNWLIDKFVLKAFQRIGSYFMPKSYGIAYLIHSYLYLSLFLFLHIQQHDIKNFCLIQIICKHICLIYRWNPNKYNHFRSEWTCEYWQ